MHGSQLHVLLQSMIFYKCTCRITMHVLHVNLKFQFKLYSIYNINVSNISFCSANSQAILSQSFKATLWQNEMANA